MEVKKFQAKPPTAGQLLPIIAVGGGGALLGGLLIAFGPRSFLPIAVGMLAASLVVEAVLVIRTFLLVKCPICGARLARDLEPNRLVCERCHVQWDVSRT